MKQKIDLSTWERGSIFEFFKSFNDSTISVTTEIECGEAFEYCKTHHKSFFIFCLYAMARAENEVREMRYRIEDDGNSVFEYDKVGIITPVKVNEAGKFVEVHVDYYEDFTTFYAHAREVVSSVNADTDPYAYVSAHPGDLGMMCVSVTPELYFTSVKTTLRYNYGNAYPLSNIGKVVKREGKFVMPLSLSATHALIDGYGIGRFFKIVEQTLKDINLSE